MADDAARATDLSVVAAIARLVLVGRRAGWRLELVRPSPRLLALLELTGLGELRVLRGQPLRQPEGGEQLGVEEVVQAADPAR